MRAWPISFIEIQDDTGHRFQVELKRYFSAGSRQIVTIPSSKISKITIQQTTSPDVAWALVAKSNGRTVVVVQLKKRPDALLLQCVVAVSDDHQAQINSLEPKERRDLVWDIRFQLLGMGIDFAGVTDSPKQIFLKKLLYWEGLTRNELSDSMRKVLDANLAVIWIVQRKFGQPGLPDSASGYVN